jgi:hypothetical protein
MFFFVRRRLDDDVPISPNRKKVKPRMHMHAGLTNTNLEGS